MSHQIITEHFNGLINVKNCEYTYDNKKYKGCCFTLNIPLDKVENNLDYNI